MNTSIVTITPEFANSLLEKNNHNRPVSKKRVEYYANLMENDKWHLTHQGIAIDKNGCIIDGQHRLLAVIKANKSIAFNISTNVENETFKYVDVGYTRTTGNVFAIDGIKNATNHAAGISKYYNFSSNQKQLATNFNRKIEMNFTHDDYLAFYYKEEPCLIEILKMSQNMHAKYRILKVSEIYAFASYCMFDKNWGFSHVQSFFENVYIQRHDSKSNAPKLLFNKLIQNITGTLELKSKVKTALIIKAFNYYTEKKSIKLLNFYEKRDKYPDVIKKAVNY